MNKPNLNFPEFAFACNKDVLLLEYTSSAFPRLVNSNMEQQRLRVPSLMYNNLSLQTEWDT